MCRELVDRLIPLETPAGRAGATGGAPEERDRSEERRRQLYAMDDPHEIVTEHLRQRSDLDVLVLLYDELNDYVDASGFGRAWFKDLESARKALSRRLKVFATGGLGLFVVAEALASPFLLRARRFTMPPFTADDVRALAAPLAEKRGADVPDEIIEQIILCSGGNALLAQYGLHFLWDQESLRAKDVVQIYGAFKQRKPDFMRHFRRTIADERLSRLPMRFWDAILRSGGKLRKRKVDEIFATEDNPLHFQIIDVLDLLRSAGLIGVTSSVDVDPIRDGDPEHPDLRAPAHTQGEADAARAARDAPR